MLHNLGYVEIYLYTSHVMQFQLTNKTVSTCAVCKHKTSGRPEES
jgi:hypothetical protein